MWRCGALFVPAGTGMAMGGAPLVPGMVTATRIAVTRVAHMTCPAMRFVRWVGGTGRGWVLGGGEDRGASLSVREPPDPTS